MLFLLLKRIARKEKYTIGKLYVNGTYFFDTLEDKDRGLSATFSLDYIRERKVYGKTAIPTGTYRVNMNTVSPKYKERAWSKPFGGIVPRLVDVPGFDGVLIHVGNTADDTLGCILVGENKEVGKVLNSTACYKKLMPILLDSEKRKETIYLQVI